MSKKSASKKKPGSQADGVRGTLWYFTPAELTVVGHDTDEQEHELCHHASNKFDAEHYDEYIAYMRLHGIVKPIVFRRDADRLLVVDGRTTTRVARVVAPLWEQDRRAEGLTGNATLLMIPAVVRRGTADELFCASRAANRRRPEDDLQEQAKDVARLVNAGVPEVQAAVKLGLPLARARQLLAILQLHPKALRRVGVDVSLDAGAKLAKLPADQHVAKLAEIERTGEKPTARAVTNKLREGSGRAPVEAPAQKLKRLSAVVEALREDCSRAEIVDIIERIRAILRPPSNCAAQPARMPPFAEDPMEAFGDGAAQPAEQEAEFGA